MQAREIVVDALARERRLDLADLWRHRGLLRVLIGRNISVRYRVPVLGAFWGVAHPLGMMAVFSLILGKVPSLNPGEVPYPAFLFAGLAIWFFFSDALAGAASSVDRNRQIMRRVYFPRLIMPLSAMGTPFVDLLVASAILTAMCLASGIVPGAGLVMMPVLLLIAVLTAVGVGCIFAGLSVAVRDSTQILPLIRIMWLFSTPVIWPPRLIPDDWQWLVAFNPMAAVVSGTRAAFFDQPFDFAEIGFALIIAFATFVVGTYIFQVFSRNFVDEL